MLKKSIVSHEVNDIYMRVIIKASASFPWGSKSPFIVTSPVGIFWGTFKNKQNKKGAPLLGLAKSIY